MLYAIIAEDKKGGVEHRAATRPEHLEHLKAMGDKIVFAGPLFGDDDKPKGSLMVIEAGSLEEAKALTTQDPFVTRGVFASYTVTRWNWGVNNPDGRGQ
jgi:uncharacterized protein YciI